MTVLSRPRHPAVADALDLARTWASGHMIDGAPALGHAVKVALVLGRHVADPAPDLVAAILLHDSPEFTAPLEVDLDAVLTSRFGARVAQVVRALEREHLALGTRTAPELAGQDEWTLYASTADKIVSLESVLRRGARSPDPDAYWRARPAFVALVSYFAAFHASAAPRLPPAMAAELGRLVARAQQATGQPRL